MKEPFFASFAKSFKFMLHDYYAMLSGAIISFFGYLLPIRNIVHLLIAFFIADVVFGYLAARKIRKERFSVKIIWEHTIPRMLVSIILITGAFMWDEVYAMDFISTYKVIGWFISGVLLYSIAENGYKITNWSIFPKIGNLFKSKVNDSTGMDITDDDKTKNESNENR